MVMVHIQLSSCFKNIEKTYMSSSPYLKILIICHLWENILIFFCSDSCGSRFMVLYCSYVGVGLNGHPIN